MGKSTQVELALNETQLATCPLLTQSDRSVVGFNKKLLGPRLTRLVACREGYANATHGVEYRWNRADLRVKEIIMSRDNIREMLADIEEAVTENLSPPRYRNDNEGDATVDPDAENLRMLVLRVAAASTEEIDRVILELQGVRDTLRGEGERLNRELARFTNINHAAMTATKVIGDHLKQSGPVKKQ